MPEPGMWWNLDIFGKFALEIRMDYWYLWKTHFLNFRDFQESPNPLIFLYHVLGIAPNKSKRRSGFFGVFLVE